MLEHRGGQRRTLLRTLDPLAASGSGRGRWSSCAAPPRFLPDAAVRRLLLRVRHGRAACAANPPARGARRRDGGGLPGRGHHEVRCPARSEHLCGGFGRGRCSSRSARPGTQGGGDRRSPGKGRGPPHRDRSQALGISPASVRRSGSPPAVDHRSAGGEEGDRIRSARGAPARGSGGGRPIRDRRRRSPPRQPDQDLPGVGDRGSRPARGSEDPGRRRGLARQGAPAGRGERDRGSQDEEGIPNVLKEAMASASRWSATRHSGIPELIEDGVSGILVPERDSSALAASAPSPGRCIPTGGPRCGVKGRAKIEREYDIDRLNDRFAGLLDGLRSQRRQRPMTSFNEMLAAGYGFTEPSIILGAALEGGHRTPGAEGEGADRDDEPARPRGRRHRHREDQDPAAPDRAALRPGRAGVRGRHQGRPERPRGARRPRTSGSAAGRATSGAPGRPPACRSSS